MGRRVCDLGCWLYDGADHGYDNYDLGGGAVMNREDYQEIQKNIKSGKLDKGAILSIQANCIAYLTLQSNIIARQLTRLADQGEPETAPAPCSCTALRAAVEDFLKTARLVGEPNAQSYYHASDLSVTKLEFALASTPARSDAVEKAEPAEGCSTCQGKGEVLLGVHIISKEMATDACEPSIEGQEAPEYGPCKDCKGTGIRQALDAKETK